jgi:ATP-dependent RNA helicase DDX1
MAGGFGSLGLMPELLKAIEELGWLLPTDVQDEAIPLILGGGDVMVAAETGD